LSLECSGTRQPALSTHIKSSWMNSVVPLSRSLKLFETLIHLTRSKQIHIPQKIGNERRTG
jgi:hypothetical protein